MSCPDWIGKRSVEASDVVPLVNQLCRNIGVPECTETEMMKIVQYYNTNVGDYLAKHEPIDLHPGVAVFIGFPEGHDANFAAYLVSLLFHYFQK